MQSQLTDHDVLRLTTYLCAARIAVRLAFEKSHGAKMAVAFVAENGVAIERALLRQLNQGKYGAHEFVSGSALKRATPDAYEVMQGPKTKTESNG